jgi:acyl-coenzyme A synthetase/AMP-(fatty) acid ligase
MSSLRTFEDLLATGRGGAEAIAASGAPALTYDGLRALAERTILALNGFGIGRNDRVVIVLPNGPEMVAAFLAIGSGATAAPLNPAYKVDEFEFYMSDLSAKALVVEAGSASSALEAAKRLGVAALTLNPAPALGAGAFLLSGGTPGYVARPGRAAPEDVALVLHTSGTTSRPKIVPLT